MLRGHPVPGNLAAPSGAKGEPDEKRTETAARAAGQAPAQGAAAGPPAPAAGQAPGEVLQVRRPDRARLGRVPPLQGRGLSPRNRSEKMDKETLEHPSFGTVQLSRVTARPGVPLFSSPMRHGAYIALRVTEASKERGLGRDWIHPGETVVEVLLSQHQWAEFVSSFGIGEGVPCTISRVGREAMPPVPEDGLRETFEGEVESQIADLVAKVTEFRERVEAIASKPRLVKADREALRGLATAIETEIGSNVPFLQAQFEAAMDKTVAVAKSELLAHVDNVARMVGMENLRKLGGPPELVVDGDPALPGEGGDG